MKSTFKKQRRGSKKNKSQRKSQRRRKSRHSSKKMMEGGSYVGKEGDIYKVCENLEKDGKTSNCMYILPSVINDLGDIKKNTGVFSTIDKDWKEIRKNIDNVTLMSNVTDQYPDDVPPAYSLIGGSKKRTKKQKGKKSKKSNSKK